MTSKELLEKVSCGTYYRGIDFDIELIKQDLDKLEKLESELKRKSGIICLLESENASLHTEVESLHTKNESLQSENESLHNSLEKTEVLLKHSIDNNAETLNELSKQIKQNNNLKQVIEILKSKGVQESFLKNTKNVNEYNKAIKHLDYFDELTQAEYELLKEWLQNE